MISRRAFSTAAVAAVPLAVLANALPAYGATPPVRVMFLGDSITQGQSLAGYRRYVVDYLIRLRGYNIDAVGSLDGEHPADMVEFQHDGHSQKRTDEIGPLLPNLMATYQPDVVVLQIGTNDVLQSQAGGVAERVAGLTSSICSKAPGVKVVVGKLTPLAVGRPTSWTYVNDHLPDALAALPASCSYSLVNAGAGFVVKDDISGPGYYKDDAGGIHPTDSGYRKMAQVYGPAAASGVQSIINARHNAGWPGW